MKFKPYIQIASLIPLLGAFFLFCAKPVSAQNMQPADEVQKPALDKRTRSLIEGSQRINADKSHRFNASKAHVESLYGPIVDELGLPPPTKSRLLSLLMERTESLKDVSELRSSTRTGSPSTWVSARKELDGRLRDDLEGVIDSDDYALIKQMVEAEIYLSQVAYSHAPTFEQFGYPLSGKQRLALASAMRAAFDPEVNAKAKARSSLPIGKNGLNELDEEVLLNLVDVLSIEQRALLQNAFVMTNRARAQ